MPLEYLALLVAVSLALVIAAVHFTGGRRAGRLDAGQAREIWSSEMQEEAPPTAVLSDDRKTAFLVGQEGRAGVVRQMGAHHVVRLIEPQTVAGVDVDGEDVIVYLRDTTLRRVKASVGNGAERHMLLETLKAMRETDDA